LKPLLVLLGGWRLLKKALDSLRTLNEERMAEAWREVARLGKVGEQYPHILADSRGWCLRWGPRESRDDKYYSTLSSLLHGLAEHLLRRRVGEGEDVRSLARFRDLVELTLKEASTLGAALDRKLSDTTRLRPLEGSERRGSAPESSQTPAVPGIGAGAGAAGSLPQAA
jgi:hypothetical protein